MYQKNVEARQEAARRRELLRMYFKQGKRLKQSLRARYVLISATRFICKYFVFVDSKASDWSEENILKGLLIIFFCAFPWSHANNNYDVHCLMCKIQLL